MSRTPFLLFGGFAAVVVAPAVAVLFCDCAERPPVGGPTAYTGSRAESEAPVLEVVPGRPYDLTTPAGDAVRVTFEPPSRSPAGASWGVTVRAWFSNLNDTRNVVVPNPTAPSAPRAGALDQFGNHSPMHRREEWSRDDLSVYPGECRGFAFAFDRPVPGATVAYTVPLHLPDAKYARLSYQWSDRDPTTPR
jgi:hypothetical protein